MLALVLALFASPASQPASGAAPALVRAHERALFSVAGKERAEAAQHAIEAAIVDDPSPITASPDGTIRSQTRTLIVLTPTDAEEGESFERLIEKRRNELSDFVRVEHQRLGWQHLAFASTLSLTILFFAFLLVVRLQRLGESARAWLASDERAELPAFAERIVADEKLRSVLVFGVFAGRLLAQAAVVYVALLGVLSLFSATRPLRGKLTALASRPLELIAERAVSGLPTVLLFLFVVIVLRASFLAVENAFDRAARKKRSLLGLPVQALGEGKLVAFTVIVLATLLLLTPFVTGSGDHLFTRIGFLLLALLGVAALPLLANVLVGIWAVFAAHYEIGARVRIGEQAAGTIAGYDLFYLHLQAEDGAAARVPHLLTLVKTLHRLA